MAIKILTKNGVDNTNIEGARFNYFNTAQRDGYLAGVLNECRIFLSSSNVIAIDTGELLIGGHRVVIDEIQYITFNNPPSSNIELALIAQISVDSSGEPTFELFTQEYTMGIRQDNLYLSENGSGIYQIVLCSFGHLTDGTLVDLSVYIKPILIGKSGVKIYTSLSSLGLTAPCTMTNILNAIRSNNITNSQILLFGCTNQQITDLGSLVSANLIINVGIDQYEEGYTASISILKMDSMSEIGEYNVFVGRYDYSEFIEWIPLAYKNQTEYENFTRDLSYYSISSQTTVSTLAESVRPYEKIQVFNVNYNKFSDTPESTGLLEIENCNSIYYQSLQQYCYKMKFIGVSGNIYICYGFFGVAPYNIVWKQVNTESIT